MNLPCYEYYFYANSKATSKPRIHGAVSVRDLFSQFFFFFCQLRLSGFYQRGLVILLSHREYLFSTHAGTGKVLCAYS
jgi:hypothetical protein